MKTKHVTTQWIVTQSNDGQTIYIDSDDIPYVASIPNISHEAMANAKLIAAAPELLESLIEIREWYEKNHVKYLGDYTPICFSKALSLIKKATE